MTATTLPELSEIYEHVMSWLHFAEAKNAILITLASGVIFAVATVYSQLNPAPSFMVGTAMIWICAWSFVAALFGVLSFMPQIKLWTWSGKKTGHGSNIHFFGHIADMGTTDFLSEFAKNKGDVVYTDLDKDLAQQIVVNSKIAKKKYAIFTVALWFLLIGATTPIGALVVYWFLIEEVH